jgi:dsRNA-specific ribonuclease
MAAKEAMKYFNGLSEELSTVEPGPEQSSDGEVLKPTATPKTNPPNAKKVLQEYVRKRNLDQGFRYENLQDPKTKEFWSKVFVGKRCFKGKEPKTKQKEAEKHVAELALNILEGRDGELDRNCEELLIEYHKDHGFPLFPQYEETACDQGKFSVECKLKKKYEYVCKDVKPKKKDVEMSLAEQAIKELEEENKIVPAGENAKSRLNLFLQKEGDSKLKYDFQGDQARFTGSLCFYAVHVFESLTPQDSKEEAIASAAMSACNGIDLH